MTEPKKLAPLRILQILYKYSDFDHPLWQEEIQRYLLRDYGIELERKAIGRTVSILIAAGFDIDVIPKCGCYLVTRVFDDDELSLLIDTVLSSDIPEDKAQTLIKKLCGLSNKYFRCPATPKEQRN